MVTFTSVRCKDLSNFPFKAARKEGDRWTTRTREYWVEGGKTRWKPLSGGTTKPKPTKKPKPKPQPEKKKPLTSADAIKKIDAGETISVDELSKMTGAELKKVLKHLGKKVSGKKAELVKRVNEKVKKPKPTKGKTTKGEIDPSPSNKLTKNQCLGGCGLRPKLSTKTERPSRCILVHAPN